MQSAMSPLCKQEVMNWSNQGTCSFLLELKLLAQAGLACELIYICAEKPDDSTFILGFIALEKYEQPRFYGA